MIDDATICDAMAEIFAEVFARDDIIIDPSISAKDVAGWDSFKQVEIIMAVEERFKIRFKSTEIDHLRCLSDVIEIVKLRGR